jgi:hypothetical protein
MIRRPLLTSIVLTVVAAGLTGLIYCIGLVNASTTDQDQTSQSRCTRFPDKKPKKGEMPLSTRCTRFYAKHKRGKFFADQPPTVSVVVGAMTGETTTVTAPATDADGDSLLYTFSTTGGRVKGDGPQVSWDLSGSGPGTYTITAEVDDGCGCVAFNSAQATIPGE